MNKILVESYLTGAVPLDAFYGKWTKLLLPTSQKDFMSGFDEIYL
jgi:hypothetical protein